MGTLSNIYDGDFREHSYLQKVSPHMFDRIQDKPLKLAELTPLTPGSHGQSACCSEDFS